MKVLTPGHRYELEYFEQPAGPGQTLQFIEKQPDPHGGDEMVTINNGTTNEEVIKMLIDRLKTMQGKVPSRETAIVITKLEEALMWCEKRTADRKARGVEGTPKT